MAIGTHVARWEDLDKWSSKAAITRSFRKLLAKPKLEAHCGFLKGKLQALFVKIERNIFLIILRASKMRKCESSFSSASYANLYALHFK